MSLYFTIRLVIIEKFTVCEKSSKQQSSVRQRQTDRVDKPNIYIYIIQYIKTVHFFAYMLCKV